jgi:hypothetical protein
VNSLIPQEYRDDEEIIRLTLEQLKKDFGTHLPEFRFSSSEKMLFDELSVQLATALAEMRKSNPLLFKSVLYRVDVRENEVPHAFKDAHDFLILSENIIRREFGKVLTRRYFSGKG